VAREGELVPGRTRGGRLEPGRGVYTCRRLECFEQAVARRGFARTLRRPVSVDPALAQLYAGRI
jgi:predicted RNA-binding protein YlxR (DUF448 family)